MKAICLALVAVTLTHPLAAVLPPFYQSAREIKALLDDPQLAKELSDAHPIVRIERNATGYLIVTSNNELQADVTYLPQQRPGPAKFQFSFQPKLK